MTLEGFRTLLIEFVDKLKSLIEKNDFNVNVAQLPWNDLRENIFSYMDLAAGAQGKEQCDENKLEIARLLKPMELGMVDSKQCYETLDWVKLVIKLQPSQRQVEVLEIYDLCKPLIDNLGYVMDELASPKWMSYVYKDTEDEEVKDYLKAIEGHERIGVVNYEGKSKYNDMEVPLIYDENYGLYYSYYHDKKLYFPDVWDEEKIIFYVKEILSEQDEKSPHSYDSELWQIEDGDVILDIGAAEGNFSLEHIEKVKHIYIAEPEDIWDKPLRATFADYLDKITFVKKFVGEVTDENCVTIDDLLSGNQANVIKMDIEGAEISALRGAKKTLENNNVKCAICTYHRKDDGKNIKELFENIKYTTVFSKGFMAPAWNFDFWDIDSFLKGDLRRGVLFAYKKD